MVYTKYVPFVIQAGILGLIVTWCIAENFLAEQPLRRKTVGQLKQETVELLANILQQTSKSIELQARIQQSLYIRIQEIAEHNKTAKLASLSGKELLDYVQQLRSFNAQKERDLVELQRLYTFVKE